MEKYELGTAKTGSDSEVLLQLFKLIGPEFVKELNGIFGFVCVGDDGGMTTQARGLDEFPGAPEDSAFDQNVVRAGSEIDGDGRHGVSVSC